MSEGTDYNALSLERPSLYSDQHFKLRVNKCLTPWTVVVVFIHLFLFG